MSISILLDRLLPRSCLLCSAPAREPLCPACQADLPRLASPACPVCGLPLPSPAPACADCLRQPPAFDATHAALRYAYPVDHLVQEFKFAHRLANADFFSRCLQEIHVPAVDLIMPVPLSPQRLRERGFNQAVEIARPLAKKLGRPLDLSSLVRARHTPPQSRLPWRARHANMRHAFDCSADLTGRSVLVVDDVMTTGATLDAVARVLKDHGAARVANLVLARAVKALT